MIRCVHFTIVQEIQTFIMVKPDNVLLTKALEYGSNISVLLTYVTVAEVMRITWYLLVLVHMHAETFKVTHDAAFSTITLPIWSL